MATATLAVGSFGSSVTFRPAADRSRRNLVERSLDLDISLVSRCLSGDETAWEELVRLHTRRVYGLCYRFTNSSSEAQDLTQEVFLRVFRTIRTFRAPEGSFTTWLTRLTRNLLIDHYRRTRQERVTDSIEEQLPVIEEEGAGGFAAPGPGAGRPGDQRDSASGPAKALARSAGSGDLARFAGDGIQGNCRGAGDPRRNGEIQDQSRPRRAGAAAAEAEAGGMNCADAEILICDYVDGTLPAERAELERHLDECPACAELARDSAAAVAFIERAAEIEPPVELVNRILFQAPWTRRKSKVRAVAGPAAQPDPAAALRHEHGHDHRFVRHAGALHRAREEHSRRRPEACGGMGRPGRPRLPHLGPRSEVLRQPESGLPDSSDFEGMAAEERGPAGPGPPAVRTRARRSTIIGCPFIPCRKRPPTPAARQSTTHRRNTEEYR